MKFVLHSCALYLLLTVVLGFWDTGTTTTEYVKTDRTPRQSFFKWQPTQPEWKKWVFWDWDWDWLRTNRRLAVVAGISHGFINIGTATIMNRRTLITACNLLDEYTNVQRDLRIWALGNAGEFNTPYRYRVWRFTRAFARSRNPEHWHGPRGAFVPRHDVCIIHTLDQMMVTFYPSDRGHFPYRSNLVRSHLLIPIDIWFTGSGYISPIHVKENYEIIMTKAAKDNIVDCSKYLPKWWGKFICIINIYGFPGVQNGAGLHCVDKKDFLCGLGCFEIRYNEQRILVFTDLRYYVEVIYDLADLVAGEYYEYAFPQWASSLLSNPTFQIQGDIYPLGKK